METNNVNFTGDDVLNTKNVVAYYDKLNKVIEMQTELIKINKELKKSGVLKDNTNKTADIKEYYKNYYKNVSKKKEREDYHCPECNCTVKYFSKTLHLNSKKHQKNAAKTE